MAYIKVENLKYRYPNTKKLALDDLNFEIEKGSFIGIAGANGAGKSTLCQAFNGLVPGFFKGAYGGRVIIDGEETAKVPVSRLCQKVGLVFQNPFNQLSGAKETVFEEIAFGLQNFGVPADEMIKRVNEVMDLLDIAEYKWRNPFDLSGGQMQSYWTSLLRSWIQPEVKRYLQRLTSWQNPVSQSLWWSRSWRSWQSIVTRSCCFMKDIRSHLIHQI